MAIAYESFASAGNTADGTTVTVNKPTGTATGDVLLAVVGFCHGTGAGSIITASAPSGWVSVAERGTGATSSRALAVWRKVVSDGSSEPSTYDFVMDAASSPDGSVSAVVARFSGVNTTTPLDVTGTTTGATSQTITFPGVTTTSANTMLVMCSMNRRVVTYTFNDGTKISDVGGGDSADAPNRVTAAMGYLAQASSGASGDKSATISGGVDREYNSVLIALKEAAPSGLSITSVTPTDVYSKQVDVVVAGTKLSNTAVVTFAGASCTGLSASGSTSLKITMPDFYTNNIKVGTVKELKIIG